MDKFGIETKKLMLGEIKKGLTDSADLFITSFSAIAVSQQDQLRRKLRENNACLMVVKNRLANRALADLKQQELKTLLDGPSAITFSGDDYLSVSKVLVEFAGKNESFKILGAYVDGQLLDPNAIRRLAAIRSKDALLAQVIGTIQSPIQGLVNTLSATIKKFVVVIEKIREAQEQGKG